MPRLSRVESQAHTRERLVRTAQALFLRDGYAATSLGKVADEAGYSKGAVYSNFRSKDELCLAALDAIRAEQTALLAAAVATDGPLAERLAALAAWADTNIGDRAWTGLEVEFIASTRHDPHIRGELARRAAEARAVIADLLTALAAELGVTLPMPADAAANALLSLGVGLGVQRAADPDVPTGALTDVLRIMLVVRPSASARSRSRE